MPATLPWIELLSLMVDGPRPEPAVRGAIRSVAGTETHHLAWGGLHPPVLTGRRGHLDASVAPAPPIRVWRDGRRLRIEEPDGSLNVIVGDTTCWQFDSAHDAPLTAPSTQLRYFGNGTQLVSRRDAAEFLEDDFTRPTGPVRAATFLDRAAWTVELAPPAHKKFPIQLVVDAQTGLVLQQRNDGYGSVDEWVEFVVGEPLADELFTWDGPARSLADQEEERRTQHEADLTRRRDWFEANVAALPLRVEVDLTVLVHVHDDETGAFEASVGADSVGSLARRPRSEIDWERPGLTTDTHRWSTPRWDWALTFWRADVTTESIEKLKRDLSAADELS
jgi:hypothetical protein